MFARSLVVLQLASMLTLDQAGPVEGHRGGPGQLMAPGRHPVC